MKQNDKVIFYVILFNAIGISHGQMYKTMDSLLNYLFNESRYNKHLRPLENQSHVIEVNFTQYLSSVENLDISSSELLITGYFDIAWVDELLTWDPELYGGRTRIQLPKDKFWKPDFCLTNGPASEESSIYGSGFAPAWVTYQGLVRIVPAGIYITKCSIDTTFYPYDTHTCYFQFVVANSDATELKLHSTSPDIHFSDVNDNGEWEIKKTDTNILLLKQENIDNISIPMFQSSFSLKRRSTYEIINSLTPVTLMFFLNIATCFVRPDSGERITFAITLYLSQVFASTAVSDRIPENSLKIPVMSYQLLSMNVINTFGVLWSIFIVNFSGKPADHLRPPRLLLRMIQRRRQKNKNNNIVTPVDKSRVSVMSFEDKDTSHTNKEEEECIERKTSSKLNVTGQEVAEVLDINYVWIVILFIIIINTIFSVLLFESWFN